MPWEQKNYAQASNMCPSARRGWGNEQQSLGLDVSLKAKETGAQLLQSTPTDRKTILSTKNSQATDQLEVPWLQPLMVKREQIMNAIANEPYLQRPNPLHHGPNLDRNKYCSYH